MKLTLCSNVLVLCSSNMVLTFIYKAKIYVIGDAK